MLKKLKDKIEEGEDLDETLIKHDTEYRKTGRCDIGDIKHQSKKMLELLKEARNITGKINGLVKDAAGDCHA